MHFHTNTSSQTGKNTKYIEGINQYREDQHDEYGTGAIIQWGRLSRYRTRDSFTQITCQYQEPPIAIRACRPPLTSVMSNLFPGRLQRTFCVLGSSLFSPGSLLLFPLSFKHSKQNPVKSDTQELLPPYSWFCSFQTSSPNRAY